MKYHLGTAVLALFAFWMGVTAAFGQTSTGVIQGTIRDETGAAIAGARVRLTNQGSNQVREQPSTGGDLRNYRRFFSDATGEVLVVEEIKSKRTRFAGATKKQVNQIK